MEKKKQIYVQKILRTTAYSIIIAFLPTLPYILFEEVLREYRWLFLTVSLTSLFVGFLNVMSLFGRWFKNATNK